ncbi:lipopolysaccharide assembly protein LapA domain-containing protein [Lentilactobacillus hilgardii]|uniref:lipopolysaccharide assembly protein LapA domain-containing protein n=1 Tax=Lentilactobacillus hilgardii TaxID=1588 RepID=UPI003FA576F4
MCILKKQVTTIISIILIILIAVFAMLNLEKVDVSFGFTSVEMPLVLLILVCLLIGALIIFLFSSTQNIRQNREYKELQNQSDERQQELTDQINHLQDSLKALETRLKNSSGKQEFGAKDQQISDLESEIEKLTDKLSSQK